ncbi:MexH family multidrug efflux RND transporter periplasmic adaptor subunit [Gemmatimonadetes bacterium T265]|nr:MexH family multidrug efflux RND transporter periplasmic adaptor subunit [Gemmatimonadetes bacterium T265]
MPRPTARTLALLATGFGLTALGGCKRGGAAQAAQDSAAAANAPTVIGPENVAVVTRDKVSSGPTLSGALTPERVATLRAQANGTVTAVYAEAGQRVARGQALARVETTGLTDQVASARAQVTATRANAAVATRDAERNDRLLASGAIASRDAETTRAQAVAARAQVASAEAQLANAQRQLGNTNAAAPFTGIVGTRSVNVGDVVSSGTALYTVVDPSGMQLTGSIPADQLSQVRLGQPVSFTVTGYPGRDFTGRVTRIAPVADPTTRQVQIIASIPNAGNALVGGLYAEGRVSSDTRDALVVPADAVDQRGVRPVVVRVRGGRAERVPVELGLRDEAKERQEIRGAIAVGDTLLRGAAQALAPGSLVRVAAAANDRPVSPTSSPR